MINIFQILYQLRLCVFFFVKKFFVFFPGIVCVRVFDELPRDLPAPPKKNLRFEFGRKLQLSKSRFDIYARSSLLLYDCLYTWHNTGHLIVYYILAGMECGASPFNDR